MIYLSEEEFEFLKREGYFGKKPPEGRKGGKKEALRGSTLRRFDLAHRPEPVEGQAQGGEPFNFVQDKRSRTKACLTNLK